MRKGEIKYEKNDINEKNVSKKGIKKSNVKYKK